MRVGVFQAYMTIGAILGVLLAGPLWYVALFQRALPVDFPEVKTLLMLLLVATIHGVVRAFAWLPGLILHVGMQKIAFGTWLFDGAWW